MPPMLYKAVELGTSGVLCQSPKEIDRYNHDEAPVLSPDDSTCINKYPRELKFNCGDQKCLTKSGVSSFSTQVQIPTFSDKPDQSIFPHISAESFETSMRALLAGTRLEDTPFTAASHLYLELDKIINLLHCCDCCLEVQEECGQPLLHTFPLSPQTNAKIIGILLDNCTSMNISDGNGRNIPQNAMFLRSIEVVNLLLKRSLNIRGAVYNTYSNNTGGQKEKSVAITPGQRDTSPIAGRKILQSKGLQGGTNRNSKEPATNKEV
ncbi:hypothetical protein P167DRAFT_568802 [Morchella conica CCBAS932]|uniref:Ankyrin n=1 Tax=Morchella conica CCBAS932 TaxID=1392247 RepID=A0A3N4KCS5_9PEZI|nr:hypothetical protein P167DRAFT_568802 [Morchella conica CCBAS932]